jgi:hypothetical protein
MSMRANYGASRKCRESCALDMDCDAPQMFRHSSLGHPENRHFQFSNRHRWTGSPRALSSSPRDCGSPRRPHRSFRLILLDPRCVRPQRRPEVPLTSRRVSPQVQESGLERQPRDQSTQASRTPHTVSQRAGRERRDMNPRKRRTMGGRRCGHRPPCGSSTSVSAGHHAQRASPG